MNWVVGIVTFLLVRIALGWLFDLSAVCEDGWRSPSIGIQGACSSHGGVDRSAASIASLVSLAIALVVVFGRKNGGEMADLFVNRKRNKEFRRKLQHGEIEAPDEVPMCPIHKQKMILKSGGLWGCRHKCDRYFYVRDFPYHPDSHSEERRR